MDEGLTIAGAAVVTNEMQVSMQREIPFGCYCG